MESSPAADLLDPSTFSPLDPSGEIPYDAFAAARQRCPVARTSTGAWYFARQNEVAKAGQDVETFVASFREPGVVVPEEEKLVSEIGEPRHGKIRRLINAAIAAHRIARLEPFVRDLAESLLQDALGRGPADLIPDLIAPLPIIVVSHLIGVPPEDHRQFRAWSDEVVEGTYATQHRTERGEGLAGGHPEFAAYLDARIAECRAAFERPEGPPDCLLSRLIEAEVDGQRLTDVEIRTQAFFLVVSGNETTRHLIGNLCATLAASPQLYEQLRADRSLIPVAIEESLRLDSPVHMLMRNCVHDTTVAGTPIAAGEKVIFGVASANRDESKYVDAADFRLDRPDPRSHLAFGGGPHVCPGATLARLEARVFLEVLCERVAAIRPVHGCTRRKVPVFWANGPASVDVELVRA